jgi:hypothetical protein
LPLPRGRSKSGALALGALITALATPALAQSSAFEPSLQDPRNAQRFTPTTGAAASRPVASGRSATPANAAPASAGITGYDSTSSFIKRKPKPRPGTRNASGKILPPPAGPAVARPPAPQIAARALYADVYRPPDAPPRLRPALVPVDPYEPIGIRAGSFLLRPSIEVSRGYDSNPARVTNGSGSQFTVVTPAFEARSQWSTHELGASLRGSYYAYDTASQLNRPAGEGRVFSRIDASRDTNFDLEGRLIVGTDNPGSPNLQADLARFPVYTTTGGTFGVAQRFNRLELVGKGTFDRTVYGNSELTDGTSSSNADRDFNQYGGRLRASYEFFPGFRPFVEIAADKRVHDLKFDRNGIDRNSEALTPMVGSTFEITRILTGEAAVGYQMRRYEDPALQELRGIVADASLTWAATGLTNVKLTATSRAEESTVVGVSGTLRRDAGLQVDHAFRRWMIGTLKLGIGQDQYVGSGRVDNRTSLGAALVYKFTREVSIKGEFTQEWMNSNAPGVDYAASVFMLGLKLQR